jgi:hypothetical protein
LACSRSKNWLLFVSVVRLLLSPITMKKVIFGLWG